MNVNWTVWLVWLGCGARGYESKGGESEFSSSAYTILDLVCALVAISPTKHTTQPSSRLKKKKKSAREQQLNGLYRYHDGGGVINQLYIHSEADIMYCGVYSLNSYRSWPPRVL